MKILAIFRLTPETTADDLEPYIPEEAQTVWEGYVSGFVREIYLAVDQSDTDTGSSVAVGIVETETITDARKNLTDLPLIKHDLITVELIELKPFTTWESLF
jgi:hypothetical protein